MIKILMIRSFFTDKELRKLGLLFGMLLLTFSYFEQGGGFNQNATIGEIREFVEHGHCSIDAWRNITGDTGIYHGKVFSNKGPSVFFFAVPLYAPFYWAAQAASIDTQSADYQRMAYRYITFCSACLWGALLSFLIYYTLRKCFASLSKHSSLKLATLFCLSTLIFPYSTVAFNHIFELFWVFMGFAALIHLNEQRTLGSVRLLGVSLGFVIMANPTMIFLFPVLFILVLKAIDPELSVTQNLLLLAKNKVKIGKLLKYEFQFIATLLLCLSPLFIYNYLNFDSVFSTNRNFQTGFKDPHLFLGIFHGPEPIRLLKLFGISRKSLIPSQTILELSLPGLYLILKNRLLKDYQLTFLLSILFVGLMMILCFNNWHGGSCYGLRYMIPGMLALAYFSVPIFIKFPRIYTALGIFGYFILLAVTAIQLFPSENTTHPLKDDILPSVLRGQFTSSAYMIYPGSSEGQRLNLGYSWGLHGYWTLLLLILIQGVFCTLIFIRKPIR